MSALICGSFAYDTIMVFQDHFKNHILPDKVHMLNVSFLSQGPYTGNVRISFYRLLLKNSKRPSLLQNSPEEGDGEVGKAQKHECNILK